MSEEKKVKKAPAKKATTAKKTTTKATAKKTTTKTTAAKKPAAKTATKVAKTTAKKAPVKKATTKKTAAKKATTTKKTATKTTAKKTTTTKKTTAKKAPVKKTTRARKTGMKVETPVVDDAKILNDLEMETPVKEEPVVDNTPVETTSTNEFGTTTVSAAASQAYTQQPVVENVATQEEKKARKGGRKVIITMVIVIILAIAAFLGLWYFSKITAHNKIVDTLDKLKAGDKATEVELIDLTTTLGLKDTDTETNNVDVSDLLIVNNQNNENNETTENTTNYSLTNEIIENSKKSEDDYIDFFKNMEYEIIEEKADFVDGYVKVKIVNKNIGKIIKKYYIRGFALSIQSAFSTQQSSKVQERLDAYLKELLTSDEIEKVGTEVTFKLKRDGFEWKLDVDKEELCDAILPGLREQLKDLDF